MISIFILQFWECHTLLFILSHLETTEMLRLETVGVQWQTTLGGPAKNTNSINYTMNFFEYSGVFLN